MKKFKETLMWIWLGSALFLSVFSLTIYNIGTILMILHPDPVYSLVGVILTIHWLSALVYLDYDEWNKKR